MMPDRPKSHFLLRLCGLAAALAVATLVSGCRDWDTFDPRLHPSGSGQASSAGPAVGVEATASSAVGAGGAGGAGGASTGGGAINSAGGAGGGGPPPVVISVYCRDVICDPGQVCCFSKSLLYQDHCGASGSCGADHVEGSCNDPTDCPGQICCGEKPGPQSFYTKISCQATCDGSNIVMCEGAPSICPENVACKPSNALGNGYSYCDTQ